MTLKELFEKIKPIIENGDGDAIIYFNDTRSGVSEEIESYSGIVHDIELSSGELLEKAYPFYER